MSPVVGEFFARLYMHAEIAFKHYVDVEWWIELRPHSYVASSQVPEVFLCVQIGKDWRGKYGVSPFWLEANQDLHKQLIEDIIRRMKMKMQDVGIRDPANPPHSFSQKMLR